MSELAEPIKANLTISVMFRDEALLEETRAILEKKIRRNRCSFRGL